MIIESGKLYRWMDIDVCLKNLIYGLCFSSVSNFNDKTEYSANVIMPSLSDIIKFYEIRKLYNRLTINKLKAMNREQESLFINSLKEHENGDETRELLCQHFYACCFTNQFFKNFSWSDQTSKPKVCLVVNAEILKKEYKDYVLPIQYSTQRPEISLVDDLRGVAQNIMFSKLKNDGVHNYEKESEVRVVLCTKLLDFRPEAVLYKEEKKQHYIYDKRIHEYLEAIIIPKEIMGMENVQQTIQDIKKVLKRSGNIEKQVRLCKRIWGQQNDPTLKKIWRKYESNKKLKEKERKRLEKYLSRCNRLHVLQHSKTIINMYYAISRGVNVDACLRELAQKPKFAVDLIYG